MARRRGTFTLSSNIELEAGAPLDSRDIVQNKEDLTNGSFSYSYVGMETYVRSEGKKYRLIGDDPTVLSNWVEVGSGSGSEVELVEISEEDYAALTTAEKNDPTKVYFRYEANGFFKSVQDDPEATAFEGEKLATGRTIESVVDGKLEGKADEEPEFTEASIRANINSGESIATILGKIKKFFTDIRTVAFTGSFNDLSDQPAIPAAANNNTITIQLNGTTIKSFTLNQATDETINIQVTKSSVGLGNVGNFYAVSTAENQGLSNLQKKNARDNINATNDEAPDETYNISNHQIQISKSSTPTTVNSFITKLRTLVINVMDDIRTWLNTEFGFDFPVLGTGHKFNAYRQATSTVPDFYESVEEALSEVANGFNDHADWIATKADSNSIPTKVSQLTNDSGFITSYTDTKNTAGTTNTTSKIFLAGATSQAANPQTYSNVNCYASGGKLYSNAKEVVNLSDSQALTNKTYNGYTLAAACAKAVQDDSSATSLTAAALPTGQTITSYLNSNLRRAKIAGAGNTRYCKITVSNSNQKYGEIIALAGTKSFIGFLSGNSLSKAINGINDLTGTVNNNEIILDSGSIYSHWLVIVSSSLGEYGTISFYN